jgi:hypothetical protein
MTFGAQGPQNGAQCPQNDDFWRSMPPKQVAEAGEPLRGLALLCSVAPSGTSGTVRRYIFRKVLLFTLRDSFCLSFRWTHCQSRSLLDGHIAEYMCHHGLGLCCWLRCPFRYQRDRRTLHLPQGPSFHFKVLLFVFRSFYLLSGSHLCILNLLDGGIAEYLCNYGLGLCCRLRRAFRHE